MYDIQSYVNDVSVLLGRYKTENAWYEAWEPADLDTIDNAWQMYSASARNNLGFLLLGDATIRSRADLVFNFGLTSAHGVEAKHDRDMIANLMQQRTDIAAATTMAATELLGPGSILSDRKWTPLLNDSFILGGVNACQEFHLAEERFSTFHLPQARGAGAETAARGAGGGTFPIQTKWQLYFEETPGHFYQASGPRVFSRELIGLMTFGYEPVFTEQELGFRCADRGRAAGATFRHYLDALHAVGFDKPDEPEIMAAIATYLFGDARALTPGQP